MTLSWNLITKRVSPRQQLLSKIHQKISKLETHLQHFPPDAVHLLVSLERHPKRQHFTVALTLRLPSNILHTHKAAVDPITAFDKAVAALLRELGSLKAELRREQDWKPAARRELVPVDNAFRFAAEPHPEGPQSLADTLATMIQRYYGRLLYHVQRQLSRAHLSGLVPKGAITAEAAVDEVVRQALADPEAKPPELSYRLWLFDLLRQELARRYRQLRVEGQESVPLDETQPVADEAEIVEGYDAENPLGIIEENLEPTTARLSDLVADRRTESPDAIAMEHDLVHYLHEVTASWPVKERAVFELHFLEGFEADEIAMLENLTVTEASDLITGVQARLRQVLLGATDRWVEAKAPIAKK